MTFDRRRAIAALLALIVGLAAAVGVGLELTDDDGDGRPDRITVTLPQKTTPAPTVAVDGADADSKRDDAIPLSPEAEAVVDAAEKAPEQFDLGGDLRGDDPTPAGVLTGPLAAQEWPGCRTAFVRSFSQRTRSIRAIALHYTAGPNLRGWADLLGLTAYSNNPRNEASWHWGVDREGHCTYNVPTRYRAWTIANLNDQTLNLEMVGTGSDGDYAGKGIAKVRAIVQRAGRLYDIPMRLGAVDGRCNVTRSGIITHWMGGPCSGGHDDIHPYSIARVVAAIRAEQQQARKDPRAEASYQLGRLTAGERRNAQCLLAERRIAHRGGGWEKVAPRHQGRAEGCKAGLLRSSAWLKAHRTRSRDARRAVIDKVTRARP